MRRGSRLSVLQIAGKAPSTVRFAPVIHEARVLARKRTASAISLGFPNRPDGGRARLAAH